MKTILHWKSVFGKYYQNRITPGKFILNCCLNNVCTLWHGSLPLLTIASFYLLAVASEGCRRSSTGVITDHSRFIHLVGFFFIHSFIYPFHFLIHRLIWDIFSNTRLRARPCDVKVWRRILSLTSRTTQYCDVLWWLIATWNDASWRKKSFCISGTGQNYCDVTLRRRIFTSRRRKMGVAPVKVSVTSDGLAWRHG